MQTKLQTKNKIMSDDFIYRIIHNEWTKKNIIKYKIDFTSQSCHKNQIYVSLLHLLQKVQLAKDIRRIILLWYIDVITDYKILNISESDMWSELSTAH